MNKQLEYDDRSQSHATSIDFQRMRYLLLAMILTAITKCYEECQGDYCPPSINKPEDPPLAPLNLIPNVIGKDPISECLCRERPGAFAVCFGRNSCFSVPKTIKIKNTVLKLVNTQIEEFYPGDFYQWHHLADLQIEGNEVLTMIHPGTLYNLTKLVSLSISFNPMLEFLHQDTFEGLTFLKYLNLGNNAFSNLHELTPALRHRILPNLVTLTLDSNSFVSIDDRDFKPLDGSCLVEISLGLCRIEYIHPKALIPLRSLESLNLSENSIDTIILTELFTTLVDAEINLLTLSLNFMGFKKSTPRKMLEAIAKSNVSSLNLSKNQFEVLVKDSFPYMPNLKLLDLREVLALSISDDAFSKLPNLKTLLLSGNRLSSIPKGVLNLQNLTFLDVQENAPGPMFHSYFSLKGVEFSNMKSLFYLNLGFNGLSHLFNNSFIGLNRLKILEIKNSSIFHIEKGSFVPLENLKILNMRNNLLVHGDAIPDVFFSLTKLKVLHLGGCHFKHILRGKANPFQNLISLEILGLEKNFFTTISPMDFKPLISVKEIDLSVNLLNSWEKIVFAYNKNLKKLLVSKNKITDITLPMLEDFSNLELVDLDQNAIQCKCVTYTSYRLWQKLGKNDTVLINAINSNVNCAYPDSLDNVTLVNYLRNADYSDHRCRRLPEKLLFLLPLLLMLLFIVSFGGTAFYYRWHIRYWIFLSKLYLSRKGKIKAKKKNASYVNFQYDAFVSYSNEDRNFVVRLVTMLENQEPFLKLCVYERDFQIGTIISESVLESVAKSRKTVLVVSDCYAKSQWCRWESQICEHHRLFFENDNGEYVDDSLVLIKLGHISVNHLTPTLKYLLKTRIYLQWEVSDKKEKLFWEKLRETLGPPVSGTSEATHT